MNQQLSLDRRLSETPEPFRSGARHLAASMVPTLRYDNVCGVPPVATYVDRVQKEWPTLHISNNIKIVSGMVVAEAMAPDFVPGRRKTAPRGSCMASGMMFVPSSAAPIEEIDPKVEDRAHLRHLAREVLERAATTFASVLEGKSFDQKRRGHLRLAITALQAANAEEVV